MGEIKIEGLAKLSRALKRFDVELPKQLKEISKDGAELVAETARTIVPVRSGRLQGKIKAAATAKGAQVRVLGLEYTKVIHFGWPRHHIAPQPFVYEARDERATEVVAAFQQGLADLMSSTFTPGTE